MNKVYEKRNDRVAILLDHPGQSDSRILRQANALAHAGYSVKIFAADPFFKRTELKTIGDNIQFQTYPYDIKKGVFGSRNLRHSDTMLSKDRDLGHQVEVEAPTSIGRKIKDQIAGFAFFRAFFFTFRDAVLEFNPTAIHANDLSTLYAGYKLKKSCHAKLIYDAHEYEISRYDTKNLPVLIQQFRRYMENKYAPLADAIITVSDSLSDELHSRLRGANRPSVILNSPTIPGDTVTEIITVRDFIRAGTTASIAVLIGNRQEGRGYEYSIKACAEVVGLHLVCLGNGSYSYDTKLKNLADKLGCLDRVHLLNAKSIDHLIPFIKSADLSLVLLEGGCLSHEFALPNKIFESLLAGLPTLVSPLQELSKMASYHRHIYKVDSLNTSEIVAKIRYIIEKYTLDERDEGDEPAMESYSEQFQAKKLREIYTALLDNTDLPVFPRLPHATF